MPPLMLKPCPPQGAPRQRALAEALSRITAETLGKRPEVAAAIEAGFAEPPAGDRGCGGRRQQARRTAAPTLAPPPPVP